jgi:hypothetical protein
MSGNYIVTAFANFPDFVAYCQNQLPAGKLVTSYYSREVGFVVIQSV